MKQCLPGQRVGGQAGAPGVSKAQAAGGVLVLLPPISEASTQGPVASASLRLWAEILSFKPWAPDGVGGGGSPTLVRRAPARAPSEVLESR